MAKQDAIIDRPLRAEKESATNGVCKDKQLKPRQDAVDVASLAISETPPSGRQDSSPRLSHRPSPQQQQQRQQQQQPQPLHPRPASGSPPIQSLLVLQEQHPLKNTTANRTRTSSPAGLGREGEGGATVDKPLDDPLPSNSTTALAADLDPTSAQTLDNSDDTEANVGLARWHSWVTQQVKNGIIGNAIDITSWRNETLEITPTSLIQYLEAVVLPLERASSLFTTDPSNSISTATNSVTYQKGATSVIETYLKPVLQLWQHQEQERQRQPRRYPDPSSSSSSVTLSSETKSFHESLSDDRAVVLNVQHTIRQQDQLQRLIHLEKSHQDTALVISQLQDQVQRLVDDCAHQTRLQLHTHQEKDQNMLRASDNESGSNGAVSLATLTERHTVHSGYSPSARRHHQRQQHQQQQTNGYYGGRSETHRAEELIEVIAKGLEEYHARAAYERARQRSGTDASAAGHDHSSWRHIELTGDNALGPLHPPQSPHDSAVDYHQYELETLDRSSGPHQRQSTLYYGEQSPTQLRHHHHHVHIHKQQQRLQTQQVHGEIQHEDLLEVPPHHPLHDRPVRSRKRSSSMSGPGGVHKENIKQARSCSPPRPRTISGTSRTEAEEPDAAAMTSVISNGHTHSQPSTGPVEKSEQEVKLDGHHKSPKSSITLESSDSTTAAASLALLQYGSVERARHHSVSPQDVNLHTRQQSAHPFTASDQRPQAKGDKGLDRYPSHSPQGHEFSYTSTQTRRVAPPPYGEDDYRSYSEHPLLPMRHHSHPSQSYSHVEDMTAQSMAEPTGYRSLELETRISPYSHTTVTTATYTEPKLPVFRGKHTKNQESFGYTSRSEPAQQRRQSYPSPSHPTSALTPASKPHPYRRDESRIYSGYEQPQQQQHQQHQPQQQHQQPHLSRHHDNIDNEDLKSPRLQVRELQHLHPQHHHYIPQAQQQQQHQQQQQQPQQQHHHQHSLYHHHHHHLQQHHQQQQQQQQHNHHHLHLHDIHHQHSLQSSSTSSPPPTSSSNQHQHQHQHQHHPPPPIYVMNRQVNTVPELWKEWTVGLGPGNPSIRQLEAQYGPSWRTSSSAANFFSRRLRIIHEIQRMVDYEGLTEEEAVNRLEARREQGVVAPGSEGHNALASSSSDTAGGGVGMSLHRLSEILRKKQL